MADTLPPLALSIRQPWAWAIINAGKDVENRDWKTKFRGPVCIHAAKKAARHEYEDAAFFMHFDLYPQVVAPLTMDVDYGGIIGVAEIVDCVEASDSPWFFGRYGFVLRNARPVDFIQVKGALGFFDWRKQLEKKAGHG